MSSIDEARKALQQLQSNNRYAVMTEVAAIFTELMEPHGLRPVIVGGLAVELELLLNTIDSYEK